MLTTAQLAARAHGIGGSDAPVILGLSPYKTPAVLWLEKTGQTEPEDLSDRDDIRFGNLLEEIVAREFSRRTGKVLRRSNQTYRHQTDPFLLGHIDRRIVGEPALLEIKTTHALQDGEPRQDHLVQVAHYLAVTGWQRAFLVYLVQGQRMSWFAVERDEDTINALLDRERAFWSHVQERTAPPPVTAADVRLLYPRDCGGIVTASDEVQEACFRLAELKRQIKDAEAEAEQHEKAIFEALGEAARLLGPDGKELATWKAAKPSRVFDRARFEAEHADLAAQFMVERPGSRRFLLKAVA